jgi:hypothetical protein
MPVDEAEMAFCAEKAAFRGHCEQLKRRVVLVEAEEALAARK